MKKNVIVLIGLLTLVAFAGSVMAQGQAKPTAPAATEKQAVPAPEKTKATEPKTENKATLQPMIAAGTVSIYEAGKMVRVRDKDKETVFDLTANTTVKGEVKQGTNVTITYKKDGDKMVATDITVTVEKKAEEKKPAPAEKKN